MKKLRVDSREKILAIQILKFIAFGVVAGSVLVCPNLAQLYDLLDAENGPKRRNIRRNLYTLQKRGLIKNGGADDTFVATQRGIREAEYNQLTIAPRGWDGKWRLCMFDIPEISKPARLALNRKVTEMGMQSFQKSVFISPYPCEEPLAKVARYLKVEKYVRLVTAAKISDGAHFKKAFNL